MTTRTDVDDNPDANQQVRDALAREKEETARLRGKLEGPALTKAGFPEDSAGRKAIDDLYTGDRTDTDAITAFAEEYGIAKVDPSASTTDDDKPNATPAPTVVADARSDLLDAGDTGGGDLENLDDQAPSERRDEWLGAAVTKARSSQGNEREITAAISAELEDFGVNPDEPAPKGELERITE